MEKRNKLQVTRLVNRNCCLACGQPLDGTRAIRGCHERCYRAAVRASESAEESLDVFVEAGRMLPASPGGRPKGSTKQWVSEVLDEGN